MVNIALVLAILLVEFDHRTSWQGVRELPLFFGAGADGSRNMLSTIAGSMLTVAVLAFSLTLGAITQVSNQYSPRVLRNLMRDRANQLVLGYFMSVFTYCMVVLGTIRSVDEGRFVPSTAVGVGFLMGLGGVGALVFFIHHIAESLQTGTILRRILKESDSAVRRLFPEEVGDPIDDEDAADAALRYSEEQTRWHPVHAHQTGYLQRIETERLLHWAVEHDVVVRVEEEVGSFITRGSLIFSVRSGTGRPDPPRPDWPTDLEGFLAIGRHRNIAQDVGFGIQQLVDISLKALSPGINDSTTASMAIDYLGALLGRLAERDFPARLRSDGKHLRVLVRAHHFEDYLVLAFDPPRINARGNAVVLRRLAKALLRVERRACNAERRAAVQQQLRHLAAWASETLSTHYEKQVLQQVLRESAPWAEKRD